MSTLRGSSARRRASSGNGTDRAYGTWAVLGGTHIQHYYLATLGLGQQFLAADLDETARVSHHLLQGHPQLEQVLFGDTRRRHTELGIVHSAQPVQHPLTPASILNQPSLSQCLQM